MAPVRWMHALSLRPILNLSTRVLPVKLVTRATADWSQFQMPAVTAALVRARTRALCEAADLATFTERSLRSSLAAELGEAQVTKFASAMKKELQAFLLEQAEGEGDEATEHGTVQAQPTAATAAASGQKRKAAAAPEPASAGPKRGGQAGSSDDTALVLRLSSKRKLSVRSFKGRVQVDLREYYVDKASGEERPSERGVALTPEQWARLLPALPALAASLAAGDCSGPAVELGGLRQAYVSDYQGHLSVQVREFYTAAGGEAGEEAKPSKKGCGLDEAGLQLLQQHAAAITAAVSKLGGGQAQAGSGLDEGHVQGKEGGEGGGQAGPGGSAGLASSWSSGAGVSSKQPGAWSAAGGGASAAGSGSGAAAQAGSKPSLARQTAGSGAGGEGGSTGGGEGDGEGGTAPVIDLGNNKRVTLSNFRGESQVDLREWYLKDAELKPGKKGISLKASEWQAVVAGLRAVEAAVAAKDTNFSLPITDKRRVQLSLFKGKLYVSIREFYEQDGVWKPGSKGCSMSVEQWQLLVAGAPAVTAHLGRV
ncbi:transcriptional Coactivator p15-domain-containing protein, partial [Haematococcus lacustris]